MDEKSEFVEAVGKIHASFSEEVAKAVAEATRKQAEKVNVLWGQLATAVNNAGMARAVFLRSRKAGQDVFTAAQEYRNAEAVMNQALSTLVEEIANLNEGI